MSGVGGNVGAAVFLFSGRFWWCCFMCIGYGLFFGACPASFNFAVVCMVRSTSAPNDTSAQCRAQGNESSAASYKGHFSWSKQEVANALSANYWSGIWVLFILRWLILRFGHKFVLLSAGITISAGTLIIPVASHSLGWPGALLGRCIAGLLLQLNRPLAVGFCASWAPVYDYGKFLALLTNSVMTGQLITQATSGIICEQLRWEFIFYIWGSLCLGWVFVAYFFVTAKPEDSRWLSKAEQDYITKNRKSSGGGAITVPWLTILRSPTVLATLFAYIANSWVLTFRTVFTPTYLKEVLAVNVTNNGLFSALPTIAQIVGRFITGYAFDKARFFRPTIRLKLFNTVGAILCSIFMISLTTAHCNDVALAVSVLTLQYLTMSLQNGGCVFAVMFIAPTCAVQVQTLFTLISNLFAIVLPYVINFITAHGTIQEWETAFYLLAAFLLTACVVYFVWGSGEPQEWATVADSTILDIVAKSKTDKEAYPDTPESHQEQIITKF